jgi:hypothetical protein
MSCSKRFAVVAIVGVALLSVVGCSSGDDSASTTTTEAEGNPEDLAAADEAMLTSDDVPDGWAEEDFGDEQLAAIFDIPGCETFKDTVRTLSAEGKSQPDAHSFTSADGESVSALVTVYPDEAAAEEYMEAYRNGDAPTCMAAIVAARDGRDAMGESTEADLGDEATGVVVSYDDLSPTLTGPSEFRWTLIRDGRSVALVYVAFDSDGEIVPETFPDVVAERLAAA